MQRGNGYLFHNHSIKIVNTERVEENIQWKCPRLDDITSVVPLHCWLPHGTHAGAQSVDVTSHKRYTNRVIQWGKKAPKILNVITNSMYDLINDNDGNVQMCWRFIETGRFCALAHAHATTTHLCIPIRHSAFYCKNFRM